MFPEQASGPVPGGSDQGDAHPHRPVPEKGQCFPPAARPRGNLAGPGSGRRPGLMESPIKVADGS